MKSSITRNVVTRPIQSGRIAGEVMLNLLFLKLCENIAQLQKVALKRPSKRTALCLRVQKKINVATFNFYYPALFVNLWHFCYRSSKPYLESPNIF